jgi:hypothetical protein
MRIVTAGILLTLAACGGEGDADTAPATPKLTLLVVAEEDGRPLEDIIVYLFDAKMQKLEGKTGPDGTYEFGYLPGGEYTLAAGRRARGRIPRAEKIEIDGPLVHEMPLDRFEGFKLRVVPPAGHAMPKEVTIEYRKPGKGKGPLAPVVPDENGEAHTWSIYPGPHTLVFRTAGYATVTVQHVVPATGVVPFVLELRPK